MSYEEQELHKRALSASLKGEKPCGVWYVESTHTHHITIWEKGVYWPGQSHCLAGPLRADVMRDFESWAYYAPFHEQDTRALTYLAAKKKMDSRPYCGGCEWLVDKPDHY